MQARLLFHQTDGLLIVVAGPGDLTDEALKAWVCAFLAPGVTAYAVVVSGHLHATPMQRRVVADTMRQRDFPMAAVTDSLAVRGLVTALRWLGVFSVRVYGREELSDMFIAMGYSDEIASRGTETVRILIRDLEEQAA